MIRLRLAFAFIRDFLLLLVTLYSFLVLNIKMNNLKVGTFNVNGINIPAKRRAIFKNLRDRNLDFCCLQETHSSISTIHLWQSEWGGQLFASHGRQNARGVAILVRRSLQIKVLRQLSDDDGRILLIEVDIQGAIYTIGSLYAPTQDKQQDQIQFLNALENKMDTLSDVNVILGGDFNCFLNQDLDRNLPISHSGGVSPYRENIKALLEDKSLCDIWRLRHPQDRGYTFRRGSYASRLDYVFISEHSLRWSPRLTSIGNLIRTTQSLR